MRENPKSEIRQLRRRRVPVAPCRSGNPKRALAQRGRPALRIWGIAAISGVILLFGGCATKPQRAQLEICPGKATVAEALATLTARSRSAVPVWANGHAVLTYYVPDRKKPERHALTIDLRFDPPARIYLQGSLTAVSKAIVLGSNEEKFWLALRPKEISSYYVGRWQDVSDFEGLVMSPRVVLESVGILSVPGSEPNAARWKLENKGPYDILTQRDEGGRPVRRLHVYACDYSVHEIEYFDHRGKIVAVAQLSGYQPVVEGFPVPTQIDVVSTRPDGRKDSVVMDLGSVWTKPFNEKQRQVFFNPPDADKFEHIYHYQDGQWVPAQ
jgi:hypothetical protein